MRTSITITKELVSKLQLTRDDKIIHGFRVEYGLEDARAITNLRYRIENMSRLRAFGMNPSIILDTDTAESLANYVDFLNGE